jgi:hypothetical protein
MSVCSAQLQVDYRMNNFLLRYADDDVDPVTMDEENITLFLKTIILTFKPSTNTEYSKCKNDTFEVFEVLSHTMNI